MRRRRWGAAQPAARDRWVTSLRTGIFLVLVGSAMIALNHEALLPEAPGPVWLWAGLLGILFGITFLMVAALRR